MALHISGGISLRVALLLRLSESVLKGKSGSLHSGQNIVGRTVQNTENRCDILLGEAGVDRADQRDTASDTGLKEIAAVMAARDLKKLRSVGRHQLLIGGAHTDPALQCFLCKRICRLSSAHCLADHRDLPVIHDILVVVCDPVIIRAVREIAKVKNILHEDPLGNSLSDHFLVPVNYFYYLSASILRIIPPISSVFSLI